MLLLHVLLLLLQGRKGRRDSSGREKGMRGGSKSGRIFFFFTRF